MAWFKRDYGTASYERAQQHFAKLFKDLGGPKGMMMVRSSNADKATLYIALSEVLAARNFSEFEPAEMPPPPIPSGYLGMTKIVQRFALKKKRGKK